MKAHVFLLTALSLAACASNKAQPPSDGHFIGSASMGADRMITVMLRGQDGGDSAGDAAFFMNPGHKDYERTIRHVGGLKPGQSKPYPAWRPSE